MRAVAAISAYSTENERTTTAASGRSPRRTYAPAFGALRLACSIAGAARVAVSWRA